MTRWTPEELRSMGKRYGEEVFQGRDGQLEVPPIRKLLAKLCAQAADDAEAVARLTAENERLARQNASIYDQMERIQHQRDEARTIAQRCAITLASACNADYAVDPADVIAIASWSKEWS